MFIVSHAYDSMSDFLYFIMSDILTSIFNTLKSNFKMIKDLVWIPESWEINGEMMKKI